MLVLLLLPLVVTCAKETEDYVKGYGYPFECHKVTTADGYILEMHRIPYGIKSNSNSEKPVAFVQHGILCSSMDWVFTTPKKSLVYMLADEGYDVWIGNFRGSKYSDNHINLTTKDKKFWNFTWNEMGLYDLPAMIDEVLEITKQNHLFYIGHSQGSTAYFVMMSEKPEYNAKVKLMSAISPVAYMSHIKSPMLRIIANDIYIIPKTQIGNWLGYSEFRPNNSLQVKVTQRVCNSNRIMLDLCLDLIFMFVGFNWRNLDPEIIPMLNGHSSGTSTKVVLHYVQEIRSGKFRQFDYGVLGNQRNYGSWEPPEYNLTKITSPVALFYSLNDWLASEKDVEILSSKLPNLVTKYQLTDDRFNHIDYMWGLNASEILYEPLIKLMNNF